jgi:DDE superfamily endonuclease
LIESAYTEAEAGGVAVCCEDEAGPYQAIPQPGETWHPAGHPTTQPHEYVRGGTAKLLTLLRPATGDVRAKGVLCAPNAVLHPWLTDQLSQVLAHLEAHPLPVRVPLSADHLLLQTWQHWWWSYERPKPAPPLRLLVIWDNLKGHLSYDLVRWLLQHGILPLYTPLSGSWLNMAESLQRILVRRALAGQHPERAEQLIEWLDHTVVGWNRQPTPFVWNGPRRRRRERARLRRLGGSGAAVRVGYSIAR